MTGRSISRLGAVLLVSSILSVESTIFYASPANSHIAEWQKIRHAIDEEEVRGRLTIAESMYLQGLVLSEKHKWPPVDQTELLARFLSLKLTSGISEQSDDLVKKLIAAKQQIRNADTTDIDDMLVAIHDVVQKYKLLIMSDDKTWCLYRVIELLDSSFQGKHRDLAWFSYELAAAYLGLGQTQEAIKTLKRAEEYNKSLPDFTKLEEYRFHLLSARIYQETKSYQKAIANATKAIELSNYGRPPDAATPTVIRGLAYAGIKNDALAKKDFAAAEPMLEDVRKAKVPGTEANRLVNLGLIRLGQKKYKEADAIFVKALDSCKEFKFTLRHPTCGFILRKRIEVLNLLGKKAEAAKLKELADKEARASLEFQARTARAK